MRVAVVLIVAVVMVTSVDGWDSWKWRGPTLLPPPYRLPPYRLPTYLLPRYRYPPFRFPTYRFQPPTYRLVLPTYRLQPPAYRLLPPTYRLLPPSYRLPQVPPFRLRDIPNPSMDVRDADQDAVFNEALRSLPPFFPPPFLPDGPWVRSAEQDPAFKVAAEDGILSDDEIKSVFGVADEDLAEFKSLYDVNDNGEITIEEYQAVAVIIEKAKEEEE